MTAVMQPRDNRDRLVLRWHARAADGREHPFDSFFFAYQAVLAAAARGEDRSEPRREGQLIRSYFAANRALRRDFAARTATELNWFASREAAGSAAPVLEFMRPHRTDAQSRALLNELRSLFIDDTPMEDQPFMEAVAALLYAVRNNLFHGDKDYDSESDAEVLRHAVVLLLRAIELFEGLDSGG